MKTRIARGAGEVEQEAIPSGIVDMPGQRVGTVGHTGKLEKKAEIRCLRTVEGRPPML